MAHIITPAGGAEALLNYFSDFALTSNSGSPNTKIDVAAGMCADSTNTKFIRTQNAAIDFTTVGPGGLDAGSAAANQTYNLFAIGGGSGGAAVNGLIASLAASPSFANASAYSVYRLIGTVSTDGSAHLIPSSITSAAAPLNNGSVTNALLAAMPTNTIKGNNGSGTADLSIAQLAAMFNNAKISVISGGSGSFAPQSWTRRMKVYALGGGGGGSGSGSGAGNGGAGGNTTFGALSANGGGGGIANSNSVAAGGTASGGDINIQGGTANGGSGNYSGFGACGAPGPWGGAGAGGGSGPQAGQPASANSGAGGGGAGTNGTINPGAGGASGGYCKKTYTTISGPYIYAVGASGAAGSAGAGSAGGGSGGSGIVIIEEYPL